MENQLMEREIVATCDRVAKLLNSSVAAVYLIYKETERKNPKMRPEQLMKRVEEAAKEFAQKTWERE